MLSYKLIAALKKVIVQADFKTVEKKFLATEDPTSVKDYINLFKKLKDQNRIQDVKKKNIDFWGKKSFEEFKNFIDSLSRQKSVRQMKKSIYREPVDIEGAKLVTENDDWFMYEINSYQAAKFLGSREWCIVRDEDTWDEYTNENNFYFFIAKNRPEDEWHKLALQVEYDDETIWNALDKSYRTHREEILELDLPVDYLHRIKRPDRLCGTCGHSVDDCQCCGNCGYSYDDCRCCPICESPNSDECGCCPNCENTAEDCTCCPVCGDTDKEDCDCCQECRNTADRCTCEDEDEDEDTDVEIEEDEDDEKKMKKIDKD